MKSHKKDQVSSFLGRLGNTTVTRHDWPPDNIRLMGSLAGPSCSGVTTRPLGRDHATVDGTHRLLISRLIGAPGDGIAGI